MRLQDLKDNLAEWARTYGPDLAGGDAALWVARRVAALYDQCPRCEGSGKLTRVADCPDQERIAKQWGVGVSCCVDHREVVRCQRCGGTGMVAKGGEPWREHTSVGGSVSAYPDDLARYLFGETP